MNYKKFSKLGLGVLLSTVSLFAVDAKKGSEVINTKCIACHTGNLEKGLSRISDLRKTPEGWFMSVNRMQRAHGLQLTKSEEADVIKYLSDNQGLTQDEIKPFKYILEKEPNKHEINENQTLVEMCNRCHSNARIGLERRTKDEWETLIHFHIGQFPNVEINSLARDRDWFGIATNQIVPMLAEKFGKNEQVWKDYKKSMANYKLSTKWIMSGHTPGLGDFKATYNLQKIYEDTYKVIMNSEYSNGLKFEAKGEAIVYSGGEVRANLVQNSVEFKQVLHIDAKENILEGRMFETLHSENGSYLKAIPLDKKELTIAGVYPSAIKAGTKTTLIIVGSNLDGNVKLPKDIKLLKTVKHTSNEIVLEIETSKDLKTSQNSLVIGNKTFNNSITLFDKVDYLNITPDYAIARIGGEDYENITKQFATFEAIGYSNGADGIKGTSDDINLGVLPVTWNLEAFNEESEKDKDLQFMGSINRYTGKFTPSEAGPNPKRKYSTNNVGRASVVATYKTSGNEVEAKAELVSTVPKYVNPPID